MLSCNRQVCACVNKPEDQINLNKPLTRLLCFAPTVTYRSQPCQTQGSSKHCVQSLRQQTNQKVGNLRELPHRNQSLWGFTPLLVLPHWKKIKIISQTRSKFLQRPVGLGRLQVNLDQTLYLQMLGKEMCNGLLNLKVMSSLKQRH